MRTFLSRRPTQSKSTRCEWSKQLAGLYKAHLCFVLVMSDAEIRCAANCYILASISTLRRRPLPVLLLNQLTLQNISSSPFPFLFFPLQPSQVCKLSKYIFAMSDFAQYLMGQYVNLILCYHCKDYIYNVHAVHYCIMALRQRKSTFNIAPNVNSILCENG